ncbi:TetR/AcrR family transcriptional regulator [Nocardia sp. KC 131]|uniref:TetR/AcrR family transcriptional regulator n=1 Tax=Nocardia arseniciresistens TaxID=3392119 RepID=UPI00398F4DBE
MARGRIRDPIRTRAVIIDALLGALDAGEVSPTAKSIAERAGVSLRSIFVHFPDLDELKAAATIQQTERVEQLITGADPNTPLRDRVDLVVAQTAQVFALQRRIRVTGLVESPNVPIIDERMRRGDRLLRDQLARTFAIELERPDGTVDEELLDLIEATTAWSFRHHLVDRCGRPPEAASDAVRRTLLSLLAGP